jgi:polysaccharide export outer membrane protein
MRFGFSGVSGVGLRSFVLRGCAGIGICGLAGCAITPASGPFSASVTTEVASSIPYALVKLDTNAAGVLAHDEPETLAGAFTDRRPPAAIKFGVGDTVSVTIFEAAAGGLFIPIEAGVRPGNFVTLPDQTVDNDGNISVPYAGIIHADGRTNTEIQNDIIGRIRNRAIEPQVVVALSRQNTSLVSVFGEVNIPARFPAAGMGAGDRITDAITRGGGIKGQGFESWVMLERKGRRAAVPFANLVYQPGNNVYVQPGDRIYVYREQQKFIAFGASGQQGEFTFDAWRINLAEGVAKAGGLVDAQADPGAVFLYRLEPRPVAEKLGVDVSRFSSELIPVIFQISFRDPAGYFIATKVQMRNQDVIFVANSPTVEVTKFLQFLNVVMQTTSNGIFLREDFKTTLKR